MSIDHDEVQKIAHLARLSIGNDAVDTYTHNLSKILDLAEQMSQIDTTDIEPMAHPFEAAQRLRNDQITLENQRDLFQSIAPQVEAGLYLVPQVIE